MFDLHYNYMVSKYGSLSILLFADTDSLCYDVKTDNLYRDFLQDLEYFDTSEYPRRNICCTARETKKCWENERRSPWGTHWGIYRSLSKMHFILFTYDNKPVEKKTAKGILKVTKKPGHQDYKSCFFEKQMHMAQINQVRRIPLGVYCTARESCIILAIDNLLLEKAYRDWNVDWHVS